MKALFKKKKLKAFTLPELVVTMILIVLLFLIGAAAYTAVYRQVALIKKSNAYYEDYYTEHATLKREWEEADQIMQLGKNKISLKNRKHNVIYIFSKKNIIRQDKTNVDTLSPGGVIIQSEFYDSTIHLLKFIQVEQSYHSSRFYTYLTKTYSSEQLLNFYFTKSEENE